jgi:hypothetical protein
MWEELGAFGVRDGTGGMMHQHLLLLLRDRDGIGLDSDVGSGPLCYVHTCIYTIVSASLQCERTMHISSIFFSVILDHMSGSYL